MSISKITPRMQKGLRDGKPLVLFANIDLSVLNDSVDSQTDFQASIASSNMDFTTKPGYAQLASTPHSLDQTAKNAEVALGYSPGIPEIWGQILQSFQFAAGTLLNTVTVWGHNNSGYLLNLQVAIMASDKTTILATRTISFPNGTDAEMTANFGEIILQPGTVYWIRLREGSALTSYIRYQNTDVYADGHAENWTGTILGDIYFKLGYIAFSPSGSYRTKRMDLGELPLSDGTFQLAYQLPVDCQTTSELYGYTNYTDTSPAVTISNAEDGASVPPYQFWEVLRSFASNAGNSQTPIDDMIEFLYPKDSLKLREKGKGLLHIADDLGDYQALLSPPEYKSSDIKILERVASGGEISCTLEDTTGETIQRAISDSPLKNYRAALYIGADVEGFNEQDLLRFFTGTVSTGKYKPKYGRDSYKLDLTFKNAILELKRKVPQPTSTGVVDFNTIGLSYDAVHVIDAMLDLGRAQADTPARSMNLPSFVSAKTDIGPTYIVRRSNAGGLPDTRIKSLDELIKHWQPLAIIADCYVTTDEDSRITVIRHDTSAVPEAIWADEQLVRDGQDAIPIEDVADIDLGYDSLLFNAALLGCGWDGTTDDWTGFATTYANVNATSANEFAPGKAIYLSIMEKNMKDAAKWLGPEVGYNGETIAQNLTQRYVTRFSYPPVVMSGVVVPNSEFMRTLGSVVQVWSKEFCKFKRRGIALSEMLKFMVLSKKIDRAKNRMVFSLLELT